MTRNQRASDQRGQITVMTLGFLLFLGLLSTVVINSSHAFLEQRDLDNLADGAALTAADGLNVGGYYSSGQVGSGQVQARRLVSQFIAGSTARVVDVRTGDGQVAVHLERRLQLAISPPGMASATTVRSVATSRLQATGP